MGRGTYGPVECGRHEMAWLNKRQGDGVELARPPKPTARPLRGRPRQNLTRADPLMHLACSSASS